MAVEGATSPTSIHEFMRSRSIARATGAPPSGREAAPASSRSADSVSLSPLASALKGNALTVFNEALSDDDRKTLDDAVRSGTLTGDEVAQGLETRLKRIGFALGGDFRVAAVDIDEDAAQRLLGGVRLLERGERPPPADEGQPEERSPLLKTKPRQTDTPSDPRRLAYFTDIAQGGDDAARKIADLGVDVGTFTNFGSAILRMVDGGLFTFR